MKPKSTLLLFISILLFFFLIYFIFFDITEQPIHAEYTRISVITREGSSDTLVNLQQGMEQAADDLDVELSIVTLTQQNDAAEQCSLLERERNSGAEAIVITPLADNTLEETIAAQTVPIIGMGSKSSVIPSAVVGQDKEMGKSLGARIFYKGIFDKKILLLESSPTVQAIQQREDGLKEVLTQSTDALYCVPITLGETTVDDLETMIVEKDADIIIALEPVVLDMAAEAIQNIQRNTLFLYGFGMTSKTPSYIEKNIITAAVIQNDFNMGYLSIRTAMEALGKIEDKEDGNIEYALVNRYNMYTKENQRLLFPFVR